MTTVAVRDKKIALAERRIRDAQTALRGHAAHIRRLEREIQQHKLNIDWLKGMPVDSEPTTDADVDPKDAA